MKRACCEILRHEGMTNGTGGTDARPRLTPTVVQFGGQTAINLAAPLDRAGVPILGSSRDAIDIAEDRRRFEAFLRGLGIPQPPGAATTSLEEAIATAERIGYPVLVRPSYVLGGRAMEVVHTADYLRQYLTTQVEFGGHPVLMTSIWKARRWRWTPSAMARQILIPGIMEHIERTGVHSGDSFAVYPPQHIYAHEREQIIEHTTKIGLALGVRGLMNVQYVSHGGRIHVIEVNPRSSRTVPFLSKVTGVPMIELAMGIMLGRSLAEQGYAGGLWPEQPLVAVKGPVFSHAKLRGVEVGLGPEMKSTGEVMGVDITFAAAFYKAILAAGMGLQRGGGILLSLADADKADAAPMIEALVPPGPPALRDRGNRRLHRPPWDAGAVRHQADRTGPPRCARRHPRRHRGDGDQHPRPRLSGAAAGLPHPPHRRRARHPLPHFHRYRRGDGERDALLRGGLQRPAPPRLPPLGGATVSGVAGRKSISERSPCRSNSSPASSKANR